MSKSKITQSVLMTLEEARIILSKKVAYSGMKLPSSAKVISDQINQFQIVVATAINAVEIADAKMKEYENLDEAFKQKEKELDQQLSNSRRQKEFEIEQSLKETTLQSSKRLLSNLNYSVIDTDELSLLRSKLNKLENDNSDLYEQGKKEADATWVKTNAAIISKIKAEAALTLAKVDAQNEQLAYKVTFLQEGMNDMKEEMRLMRTANVESIKAATSNPVNITTNGK